MASAEIIVGGIAWLALGVVTALAAVFCGRPFWPWLLYSVAFWPLAIIHLVFYRPRMPGAGPIDEEEG